MNRNEIDFTGRMQAARDLAQDRRNKGLPTGKPAAGWNKKRHAPTGLDAIESYFNAWRYQWQRDCEYAVEAALFWDDYEGLWF